MPDQIYYLTVEEMRHYQYMLDNGYNHKIIEFNGQEYIIFALKDKPYIGIAWPSVTGQLDGALLKDSIMFKFHLSLQQILMQQLKFSTIRVLLFPKYGN